MSEEKKARIRIISRMTEPEGDVHVTKNARSGRLVIRETGELALEYDDEQEGERAHITLTMTAGRTPGENRAQMQRRGAMSAVLTFLPGERVSSAYVTVYGEIPVAVDTRSVEIDRQDSGGRLLLDYDVYMGGERTSAAQMEITWRV